MRRDRQSLKTNRVNGVIALVTAEDFLSKDPAAKRCEGDLRMVSRTFLFYTNTYRGDATAMTGNEEEYMQLIQLCNKVYEYARLFVPYSSAVISLSEQKQFFKPQTLNDAYECIHGMSPSLKYSLWKRMRVGFEQMAADYLTRLESIRLCCAAFAVICAIFIPIFWLFTHLDEDSVMPQFATSTIAYESYVQLDVKKLESPWPAMADESKYGNNSLVRGVVAEDPVHMGGGLVSVPVLFGKITPYSRLRAARANASLGLKPGDSIIVRYGRVLIGDVYQLECWVVTEAEAEKLVETGRFRFDHQGQ